MFGALITAMQRDEALAVAFQERFLAPLEQRTRTIFERAKARGEIADDVDLALIGSVLPSIAIFRALARNEAVGPELIEQIVDQVVLPACRRLHAVGLTRSQSNDPGCTRARCLPDMRRTPRCHTRRARLGSRSPQTLHAKTQNPENVPSSEDTKDCHDREHRDCRPGSPVRSGPTAADSADNDHGHSHLGIALVLISAAQLMIVLDGTVVNIALPHIQTALGFSQQNLQWVVTGYTLAFAGLLLLGGRSGDLLGRRRMFITGVLLFAFASGLGGLAQSETWLILARLLQGVGAAIASPTALVADHHDLPGRAEAQPRDRRVRRDVRRRRGDRADPGRRADPAPLDQPRLRLAADPADQRADRAVRGLHGSPGAR